MTLTSPLRARLNLAGSWQLAFDSERIGLQAGWVSGRWPDAVSDVVQVPSIEDRIRELCERAAVADESEVEALFAELKALLAEHSQFVRYLAAKTLNRTEKGPSSSNAAD